MGFQTLFVDFTVCNLKNSIACSSAAGKIWGGGMGGGRMRLLSILMMNIHHLNVQISRSFNID